MYIYVHVVLLQQMNTFLNLSEGEISDYIGDKICN